MRVECSLEFTRSVPDHLLSARIQESVYSCCLLANDKSLVNNGMLTT